ncbi:MAG TPA: hypothetical protein VIK89_16785 [Cytophagaceae bacterium]
MKLRALLFIPLFFAFFLLGQEGYSQDLPKVKKRKGQSQQDLDEMNASVEKQRMTKEQKQYLKEQKKSKKKKEKNDKITRKRAQKISSKRLNTAKKKVGKKKKLFLKTH